MSIIPKKGSAVSLCRGKVPPGPPLSLSSEAPATIHYAGGRFPLILGDEFVDDIPGLLGRGVRLGGEFGQAGGADREIPQAPVF